jgi:hypothetical protein
MVINSFTYNDYEIKNLPIDQFKNGGSTKSKNRRTYLNQWHSIHRDTIDGRNAGQYATRYCRCWFESHATSQNVRAAGNISADFTGNLILWSEIVHYWWYRFWPTILSIRWCKFTSLCPARHNLDWCKIKCLTCNCVQMQTLQTC